MKRFNSKKQKGFSILAVILVIVAVIAAIGIWALSGQINTSNSGSSSTDMQASTIINDSSSIKLSFDELMIDGAKSNTIIFMPNVASTSTAPNMLDPSTGVQVPKVNSSVIKASPSTTEGYWVYNPAGLRLPDIGVNANPDYTILLSGIKKSVCESINKTLNGTIAIPASPFTTSAAVTMAATITNPNSGSGANDLTGITGAKGWTSGCLTTVAGGDQNFFFRVLQAN